MNVKELINFIRNNHNNISEFLIYRNSYFYYYKIDNIKFAITIDWVHIYKQNQNYYNDIHDWFDSWVKYIYIENIGISYIRKLSRDSNEENVHTSFNKGRVVTDDFYEECNIFLGKMDYNQVPVDVIQFNKTVVQNIFY